jgi:hypothetical protein
MVVAAEANLLECSAELLIQLTSDEPNVLEVVGEVEC